MKIGFVGLGKLGFPCAEVFAQHYTTFGYDVVERLPKNVKMLNSLEELANNTDIIFIAIQTPHDSLYGGEKPTSHLPKKDFDYVPLANCLKELDCFVNSNHIIVIISTVLPGTIRNFLAKFISKATLLYNPYLIAMGTVKDDFCNPEMVIMGSDGSIKGEKAIQKLTQLYKKIINPSARFEIGTWEEAESIKIFYNTFISAKIAIVNMIQDVSEKIGNMNVDVVTKALANSNKRIISKAYMKAGMGDGGPCHPRDNIALSSLAERLNLGYDLFDAMSISREAQAQNLAKKLASFGLPVSILGTNYKPNTELRDGSYGLLLGHYLKEMGVVIYLDCDAEIDTPHVYLICHENTHTNFSFKPNSVILDVWRTFTTQRNDLKVVAFGK